jgi:ureidoglycolate lyase
MMKEIEVKELSRDKFHVYGDYQDLLHAAEDYKRSGATNIFVPDCITLTLGNNLPVAVSVARVSKTETIIETVEYHKFTCEGIMPIDGDCIIFVSPASFRIDTADIEAYRVPKGTFVQLQPGVLHGRQFTLDTLSVNVLILLPQRTYANDIVFEHLEGENRVEIKL